MVQKVQVHPEVSEKIQNIRELNRNKNLSLNTENICIWSCVIKPLESGSLCGRTHTHSSVSEDRSGSLTRVFTELPQSKPTFVQENKIYITT